MDDGPPKWLRWQTVGLYLTAAWLFFVVAYSGGDRAHPLFTYIFTVPMAAWVAAVAVAWLRARRRGGGQ